MTGPNTGDTNGTVRPTTAATPTPRPATATTGGAAAPTPPPAARTVSARPTASPSQAGHNPNVILPRSQMTKGQQRALDQHNAEAIKKRDETVANYLRSVLPSDQPDQPAADEPTTPNAES